jgi:hypothetical protein
MDGGDEIFSIQLFDVIPTVHVRFLPVTVRGRLPVSKCGPQVILGSSAPPCRKAQEWKPF